MSEIQPVPQDASPSPRRGAGWARSLGAGAAGLGAPALAWWAHPALGIMVTLTEMGLTVMVVGAALFGSQTVGERAFRLLRWLRGHPEPRPRGASPTSRSAS